MLVFNLFYYKQINININKIPFKVLSLTIKTIILAGIKLIPITKISPAIKPPTEALLASSYDVSFLLSKIINKIY